MLYKGDEILYSTKRDDDEYRKGGGTEVKIMTGEKSRSR